MTEADLRFAILSKLIDQGCPVDEAIAETEKAVDYILNGRAKGRRAAAVAAAPELVQ